MKTEQENIDICRFATVYEVEKLKSRILDFEGRTFSDHDKLDDANIKYYEENKKLKLRFEELENENNNKGDKNV